MRKRKTEKTSLHFSDVLYYQSTGCNKLRKCNVLQRLFQLLWYCFLWKIPCSAWCFSCLIWDGRTVPCVTWETGLSVSTYWWERNSSAAELNGKFLRWKFLRWRPTWHHVGRMDGSGAEGVMQQIWLPPRDQPQISCVSQGKGFNPQDSPPVQAGQRSVLPPFFTLCVKPRVCKLPTGQPASSRLQERGNSPKALQSGVICSCGVPQCFTQGGPVWTSGI